MHADELDLDAGLVRRLLRESFPHWADLPVRREPSSGTDNALFRLGRDLCVRLPRRGGEGDTAKNRWLPWLAPRLPVPIPEVLAEAGPSASYPGRWTVCRWLEGAPPDAAELALPAHAAAASGLAVSLAAFVSALRALPADGVPAAHRGDPPVNRDAATRAALSELSDGVLGVDVPAAREAWDSAAGIIGRQATPVWVHGDLMPGNLLTRDGTLTAVIDFGCAGAGDPACDLMVAWNLLPPHARSLFRERLGADDDTWARGRIRALSMALIALPYYLHTNPVMAENAAFTIRQVLADRS